MQITAPTKHYRKHKLGFIQNVPKDNKIINPTKMCNKSAPYLQQKYAN